MKKYYSSLDTLRAIAILSVIFYHTIPHIFPGGFLGVNLFFVLSGYLMTATIIMELFSTKDFDFKRFYQKRLRRIYPPLLLLLGTLSVFVLLTNSVDPAEFFKDSLASLLGVNNQWQLVNQVSYFDQFKSLYLLKHLWSLSIELQFYIFYPLFLVNIFFMQDKKKIVKIQRILILVTLFSILVMSFLFFYTDINFTYYSTLSRLSAFTIGGMFFIKSGTRKDKQNIAYPFKVSLCLLALFTFTLTLTDHSVLTYNGGMFTFSMISGFLIFFIVESKKINTFLDIPLLTFIGKRSYDMYLFYLPTILIFEHYSGWDGKNPYLVTLLLTCLIMAIGHLSYHLTQKISRKDILFSTIIISSLIFLLFFLSKMGGFTTKPNKLPKTNDSSYLSSSSSKEESHNSSSTEETTEENMETQPKELFFVGDSVLLGTKDYLNDLFKEDKIEIDAEVGRQLYEVKQTIDSHPTSENLVYVLSTGNNGLVSKEEIESIIESIDDHSVYLITTAVPRSWKTATNNVLKETVKDHNNVHLIDWEEKVLSNPDNNWFDGDDIHLNQEGAKVYGELIQSSLNKK
ncbi:acyltransferase family protein [Vagococcus carniphilus]|uniref:acyltransferase family protein n=1 Tax=Vagococcus carniphilus TaxID=218144 RepID=UPI00288E4A9B|nr:acyltransferase family protein [Vagococcus carniphilus]MDT2865723.1 acyltransferase family protein [Vagococcus carniphilus]